jgi:acetyl-CoA carboxylase carboxyltransferase component
MAKQLPIIGIWHSGGARLSDGVSSLNAFGEVFQSMILASGRIPQLSLVLGPTAGGGAYGPALTDIVVLAPNGRIFVTGPDVVKSVTGEKIDIEKLGGPDAHRKNSGVAHVIARSEDEAFAEIRDLASLFADQGLLNVELVIYRKNRPLAKHLKVLVITNGIYYNISQLFVLLALSQGGMSREKLSLVSIMACRSYDFVKSYKNIQCFDLRELDDWFRNVF